MLFLFPFLSSDTIDMTLKVSIVDEFSQKILHKGRNSTRLKTEFLMEYVN